MFRKYEKPELNVVAFSTEDIVVTSWTQEETGTPENPSLDELIGGNNNGGGF